MTTYAMMRLTRESASIAQSAVKSGELLEVKDRHGVIHKGYVRGVEYQFGLDAGWFAAIEIVGDETTGPVLQRLMQQS
jgi:hypothetical protein